MKRTVRENTDGSAKERSKKSWMREGMGKSWSYIRICTVCLVEIKQNISFFSCHSCSNLAVVHYCQALQGQIQPLSLLLWPHLTDQLSQRSYLSISLKLFSV